ncbi:hypothetical protein TPHA_0M00780 [Tetrapisispora phaffii CBS 4417]|uniref:ATP synthase subunit K, mitochondrial n=1 Tax=Tetrapisispora phaffii (strain ATCC 24235 / CBS 4417 / NBRC 1672 / NRRL Y-8282 / UCD 70-5) TaxID=1071381 RepID=G8C0D8_TETPH|nr:hypothetical protein TPHA_0M00780 [Tetrapisispora phaffii CBS 4417]CCE65653.1 hypothetical protein TPHA_0M00780 [Tetrapisispora phaffii CBS 4417]
MGGAYTIFGRSFPSHQLALATIGLMGLLIAPNPFAKKEESKIDFKASSPEEEKFIKDYIKKHATEAK